VIHSLSIYKFITDVPQFLIPHRPSELVESKTEKTEEDVMDEMKNGSLSLGFPSNEPFAFPGLHSDIEALEKGFFGSLGSVLGEAERMTNDFFKSFGFPSTHERESSPFPRQPADRHIEEGTAKKPKENDYSEFSGQITDV
jgi:hypothetical protein